MLEDEIQYLGTKSAPFAAPAVRPFPGTQNPVTGVVLHVEANGGQPPCEMTFLRSQTSAVTIGRKSTSDQKSGPGDEPSIAGFACQVVSGKHAKLAFSDSGFVYIIDLGSRHGTHIRRPGETVSKMLDPEIVTMLNSGDYITFGKTVGKGSQLVPPITARVQFLYGPEPEIYEVPSKTASPFAVSPEPARPRKTSGRYGLYVPSSFSSPERSSDDDSLSSKYDRDSDIEEIPAHQAKHAAFSPHSAMPALRALQAQFYGTSRDHPIPLRSFMPDNLPPFIPSRSHSPMDLSSPTPSPVGAYPLDLEPISPAGNDRELISNHSSEASSDGEDEKEEVENEGSPESPDPLFSGAISPSPPSRAASVSLDADLGRASAHMELDIEWRSPSPPSEFDFHGQEKPIEQEEGLRQDQAGLDQMSDMSAQISDTIERIGRELQNAAALNDKWSSGNIMSLNAALSGLPEAIDLQEWATSTINRATAGASSSSHLDGRVNAAGECLPSQEGQDDLSNPPLPSSSSLRDNTTETLAEVQAGVAAMTALVSELRTLHENMEKQMTEKLAAIESARAELATATAEAQVTMSLKRKRTEMEDEDCASMVVNLAVVEPPTPQLQDRPVKRIRRIASSVIHTATAVTVGAVATWTVLAFS